MAGPVPGRRRNHRPGRPGTRRLRGGPVPGAGPRRHRRHGEHRRRGTVRRELVLHRSGLGHRPVRHPDPARTAPAGSTLAEQFTPAVDPTLALPLAGGRGYWLVGVLDPDRPLQLSRRHPQGHLAGRHLHRPARPAVVHHQTDTFITTYTAIDPLHSAGGPVTLDGFFGWPLTVAS